MGRTHLPVVDSPNRHQPDVARRQQQLRRDLELQARTARRTIDETAARARSDIARDAAAAQRSSLRATPASRAGSGSDQPWDDLEDKLLVWILPVAAIAAVPLVAGHLSAVLVSGRAPSYPMAESPGIIGRLISAPGDPAAAWAPVNTGGAVGGPVAFWTSFAFLVVVLGLVGLLIWAIVRTPSDRAGGRGWGRAEDVSDLRLKKGEVNRVMVGEAGGKPLAVAQRHSVLAVGPAHSGKSSGLSVPAVFEWEGPAVVASAKGHVIDETIGWRSHQGEVHVYAPAGITSHHRSGWSILAECSTWSGAIQTAADLTLAARFTLHLAEEDDSAARPTGLSMALAPYLLAAVASGRSIGDVVDWIERGETDAVFDVLSGVDRAAAQTLRRSAARRDDRRRDYLLAMAELLQVYVDPVVGDSMDRHEIEPSELLDGGHHTLYVNVPEHDQERFRSLCSMLVRRVIAAAYEMSSIRGKPLDPPLLVVLDDVAGIAPIYDLGSLASTAAGHGIQILSIFQDRGQIDDLYGPRASTVIRNHRIRMVLPGGHRFVAVDDPIVEPDLVGELDEGEAALAYSSHKPVRVRLRTWHGDRALRSRAATPQDLVRPADDASLPANTGWAGSLAEQSARWMRSSRARTGALPPDPGPPLDTHDPSYVEVFGSTDDTERMNVTRLPERRPRGDR